MNETRANEDTRPEKSEEVWLAIGPFQRPGVAAFWCAVGFVVAAALGSLWCLWSVAESAKAGVQYLRQIQMLLGD